MEKLKKVMNLDYIKAIVKKDLILSTKYKLQLVISYISVLVYLFTIYNFSKAVNSGSLDTTNLFSSNPFLFLITGYMIIDLTTTILNIITSQINFYQTAGMFEEMMSIDNQTLFYISSFIFVFILWFVRNLLYFFISIYFFNLDIYISLNFNNILIFFFSLISIIVFLFGISFLAASFAIIFKKGNPIIILGVLLTTIFSGAIYPINVLPSYMINFSNLIPTTHFLNNFRIFFNGGELEFNHTLTYLTVVSIALFFGGLFTFFYSIIYSKKTGKAYTY